jgi:regulator-associated protein of mTOR
MSNSPMQSSNMTSEDVYDTQSISETQTLPETLFHYQYYSERRHENNGNLSDSNSKKNQVEDWRMRERLKTVSVALVLCLNIGIDPPDIVKTSPCAKLECWIDPFAYPQQKALETIGKLLQQQYEVWQPRARYKLSLDPSAEETKKLCCSLRRNAKEERVLFHYNGHGVPKPTPGGEIWVFNKNYTQYIPVSIHDIQTWLGSPSIFVYDCSNAGNIVNAFNRFAKERDNEARRQLPTIDPQTGMKTTPRFSAFKNCIQLAACGSNEILPMNPDLPADIFSCCLTTPIQIALRWFVMQNPLLIHITPEMINKIPGRLNDRRTPLGELNWIFTAITDTIAWNVLPNDLFKRLFRQDLMVAALFRNYLLAERIMRSFNCHPMSSPVLPPTYKHSLWKAWDLAADMCLSQLPNLIKKQEAGENISNEYQHSTFFTEQLTAFEVWLAKGAISKKPPEQLPIVLQVLLSQVHRLRALMLLSRFLDLGPWAVNLALSVGIFPYVLKLLQSPAAELKPVLVFIWAKILAVDQGCQSDLLKDSGYAYFINILSNNNNGLPIQNISEHRAMCCFILSVFCHNFREGQQVCLRSNLLTVCVLHLNNQDPLLRQWACICIGKVWENYPEAKTISIRDNIHERLYGVLTDIVPEVRAAAMYALGTFIGGIEKTEQVISIEHNLAISVLVATADASPLVRRELVIALSAIVYNYHSKFVHAANELMEEERKRISNNSEDMHYYNASNFVKGKGSESPSTSSNANPNANANGNNNANANASHSSSHNTIYSCVWKVLLNLSVDPYPEVAQLASCVVDDVNMHLLNNSFSENISNQYLQNNSGNMNMMSGVSDLSAAQNSQATSNSSSTITTTTTTTFAQSSGNIVNTLRRSRSIVDVLKNLTNPASMTPMEVVNPTSSSQNRNRSSTLLSSSFKNRSSSSASLSHLTSLSPLTPKSSDSQKNLNKKSQSSVFDASFNMTSMKNNLPKSDDMNDRMNHGSANNGPSMMNDSDIKPESMIPLKSVFFYWSCEYFTESQTKVPEPEDPGSVRYNERQYKHERLDKLINDTHQRYGLAAEHRFDERVTSFSSDIGPINLLTFHEFEPWISVANDKDIISLWNYEKNERINTFSNLNPIGSKITSLKFINEDDITLIMAGSNDGVVRLFRNIDEPSNLEIVSGWRALSDVMPTNKISRLILDWQQFTGSLLCSGDVRVIRIWDAQHELCMQEIPTKSNSCVTCLTSDNVTGNLIVAGFGDGMLKLYDRRSPSRESMLATFTEHSASIVNAFLGRGGSQDLITGSSGGDIKFWDLRVPKSLKSLEIYPSGELTSLTVHEHAPLISCGINGQSVKIFNTKNEIKGSIRAHEGFLGSYRNSTINCLGFHPHQLLLGCGSDNNVTIFGSEARSIKLPFMIPQIF